MRKAFTIVELLVAVALLAMLMAISSMVFAAAVKAYRTAGAANEIAAKLQVMTQQLDDDFHGLRKEGEFFLIFMPSEQVSRVDGSVLDADNNNRPDQYISFDTLFFFANEDAQTFKQQPIQPSGTTPVSSNVQRVCYIFGKDSTGKSTARYPEGEKRLICRTQHLISEDENLKPFPDSYGTWDSNQYYLDNFLNYQYQTLTMHEWWNLPAAMKNDILTELLDVSFTSNVIPKRGPEIDMTATTLQNLFMQGIGQFHAQVWRPDLGRWYPEYDPNGDGSYVDSDYPTMTSNGQQILETNRALSPSDLPVTAFSNWQGDTANYSYSRIISGTRVYTTMPFCKALKFTFTLYDSNGVFKDGKTFTHIVYLND